MQAIADAEIERFPELRTAYHRHTAKREDRRIARRLAEWHSADVVIAASTVTQASFAAAGLDVAKVRIVPRARPRRCPAGKGRPRSRPPTRRCVCSGPAPSGSEGGPLSPRGLEEGRLRPARTAFRLRHDRPARPHPQAPARRRRARGHHPALGAPPALLGLRRPHLSHPLRRLGHGGHRGVVARASRHHDRPRGRVRFPEKRRERPAHPARRRPGDHRGPRLVPCPPPGAPGDARALAGDRRALAMARLPAAPGRGLREAGLFGSVA